MRLSKIRWLLRSERGSSLVADDLHFRGDQELVPDDMAHLPPQLVPPAGLHPGAPLDLELHVVPAPVVPAQVHLVLRAQARHLGEQPVDDWRGRY